MPIELRILTGSRGGHRERFENRAIALGRHLESDLRFDPNFDLDVSARHAEIVRGEDGAYRIRDVASTNGTFLNGLRITGEERLTDGDVIWLGAEGPRVEVRLPEARQGVSGTPTTAVRSSRQRLAPGERARVAVRQQTAWMRRVLTASLVVLVGGAAAAYWAGHRPLDSLDVRAISARNDSAIALLVTELDGKPSGGTAFGVSADGMLVTNKHHVVSPLTGQPATQLGVTYANTGVLLHAHVVRVAPDSEADLALVQVEEPGRYPVVAGVARSLGSIRVGSPVVAIGFPRAFDSSQDGDRVKPSLTTGTIRTLLPGFVQIDADARLEWSGSPVFEAHGWVIGVVYGGETASRGLTYAISSERLAGFVPEGLVKPH